MSPAASSIFSGVSNAWLRQLPFGPAAIPIGLSAAVTSLRDIVIIIIIIVFIRRCDGDGFLRGVLLDTYQRE